MKVVMGFMLYGLSFLVSSVLATAVPAQNLDQGNLFGAAQVCGLSTAGLHYASSDPSFEYSRQRALNSRQDCAQVTNTLSQLRNQEFDFRRQAQGYGQRPNLSNLGNLYGAAEVCRLSTGRLTAYLGDPSFEAARRNALNSRQDCTQVANTLLTGHRNRQPATRAYWSAPSYPNAYRYP